MSRMMHTQWRVGIVLRRIKTGIIIMVIFKCYFSGELIALS